MPTSVRRLGFLLVMLLSLGLLLSLSDGPSLAADPQPTATGPTLSVNVQGTRYPISPDIYGMNLMGVDNSTFNTLAQTLRLPVERWGGNATSRYNWQTNSFNSGLDWYFEGNPNTGNNPANGQPSETDQMITRDKANSVKTIITIPTIGYVSKGRTDHICGFSVAKYGPQKKVNSQWAPDCGNGVKKSDGTLITGNNPLDTSIAVGPSFQQSWITDMINKFGNAANGGVKIYQLDNEPSDWYETHRDVHPNQLTYDNLRDYTYTYGAAIKQSDPTAMTLGPSNFGWYVYADSQVPGDKAAHNNVGFSEWYLQQMKLYEQQHGVRILDYFDQHYYPAQAGVTLSSAGSATTEALRLRSTRSLWDPTYTEESWIHDVTTRPIQVLRDFHTWIDNNYPGTKLAITEYNWGGLESINGALAQADVLGIFGRERVDLATMWAPPSLNQPGAYAFRIYRNYDGQGSQYGDTWVQASSTDQGQLSIYAAERSSDKAVTMVIINKTSSDLTSTLNLSNFTSTGTAKVYRYSSANLNAIVPQADQTVGTGGFTATYPANSITLIVMPPKPVGNTLNVTATSDNGSGAIDTLSKAIMTAQSNDTIMLNVSSITISGALPVFGTGVIGVTISGGACSATPVTLNFTSQPGMVLSANLTLQNILLTGKPGPKALLTSTAAGSKLICSKVKIT